VIGVGANPASSDRDYELHRFYWKVEAGAEFAITQPVFDPEQLLAFIDEPKTRGIWIPIVAGIWPLVSARNAEFRANEVPGADGRTCRASRSARRSAGSRSRCACSRASRESTLLWRRVGKKRSRLPMRGSCRRGPRRRAPMPPGGGRGSCRIVGIQTRIRRA